MLITICLTSVPHLADQLLVQPFGSNSMNVLVNIPNDGVSRFKDALRFRNIVWDLEVSATMVLTDLHRICLHLLTKKPT